MQTLWVYYHNQPYYFCSLLLTADAGTNYRICKGHLKTSWSKV